jgi:diaminohydroxyphosphoribosylaminopyrimidine deaminase/5-amino-6-(5-phosphoribosylamino)uracil reductase
MESLARIDTVAYVRFRQRLHELPGGGRLRPLHGRAAAAGDARVVSDDDRWMALALALGGGAGASLAESGGGLRDREGRARAGAAAWTADGGRPMPRRRRCASGDRRARGHRLCDAGALRASWRTPPCAEAWCGGVARVVVACGDPDPRVAGGACDPAGAGIEVVAICGRPRPARPRRVPPRGHGRRPIRHAEAGGLARRADRDGLGGKPWITGPESRAMVHAMRARHDA